VKFYFVLMKNFDFILDFNRKIMSQVPPIQLYRKIKDVYQGCLKARHNVDSLVELLRIHYPSQNDYGILSSLGFHIY
jgi:hypothetical protein